MMRRSHALALAGSILVSVPGVASGQPVPAGAPLAPGVGPGTDDRVDLKNGGLLRGRIVSLEPGKEVVILVEGTGETRRVPWDEIAKVTPRSTPATLPSTSLSMPVVPSAPTMLQPGADAPSGPVDGAPHVHIQSDQPGVQLFMVSSFYQGVDANGDSVGGANYRPVCLAPCDRIVDGRSGQLFVFGGELFPQSSPFELVGRGSEVSFDVKAGSAGKRLGGTWMLSFGGAAIAGSIAMFWFGSHTQPQLDTKTGMFTNPSPNTALLAGGGGLLGAGLGLLIGGIVMIVKSATTYTVLGPGVSSSTGRALPISPRLGANPLSLTF